VCTAPCSPRGTDPRAGVGTRGGLDEKEARWFFKQLILALDYCHKMVRGQRPVASAWSRSGSEQLRSHRGHLCEGFRPRCSLVWSASTQCSMATQSASFAAACADAGLGPCAYGKRLG
jgi:hypothetical protein